MYPAAQPPGDSVITYDTRDYLPEAVRALLTADVPAGYSFPGTRDAAVAPGTFPLVLFSHGFASIRVQSSFLAAHLASYGMIVAAPDHPSRSLSNVLLGAATGDPADAIDDLGQTLDLLRQENAVVGGRFEARVDEQLLGLIGHSAGGATVASAGLDADAYVSMAAVGPPDGVYAETASLFLAGTLDAIVPPAEATRPAYEAAPSPSSYVELHATGHNGFDDFCTFGNGAGIIGLADASGLTQLLDARPELRSLGEDGCVAPAAPVDQGFPVIRHVVTSFLR